MESSERFTYQSVMPAKSRSTVTRERDQAPLKEQERHDETFINRTL